MKFEEKERLAHYRNADLDASAVRVRAARKLAGISQLELANIIGVKKSAISAVENARAFPSRDLMLYFRREHRLDFNYFIDGDFAQLPADVQDPLFDALKNVQTPSDQVSNSD